MAGTSWLPTGLPAITGVALSNGYFTGTPTAGTTIGALSVTTTGVTFTGTLTLGGADAAKFSISGSNLQANPATTLSAGVDYALTVTATQTGQLNSGVPQPIHVYGGVSLFHVGDW